MTDRAAVSALERAILNYRKELLRNDANALKAILDVYQPVRVRLIARVAALETALADAGTLSTADVLRLDRAKELLAQTDDELRRLMPRVEGIVGQYRQVAVNLAVDHAQGLTLITAATDGTDTLARVRATWTRLNTGAAEQIAGRLQQGSPLRTLLDNIEGGAGRSIADALRESVALGRNPRATAAILERVLDVPAARLLLIARTEQLNSYRGATVATYQENADILEGFVWTCSRSSRTCLTCLSMDGAIYPLDSTFNKQHPACRCSYRPKLIGVNDDGMVPTGREWFYSQTKADQLKMLPQSARDEFAAGKLDLADFVKVDENRDWGQSHRVGGVGYARDQAKQRREAGTTLPKPRAARRTRAADDDGDLVTVRERAA